MKQFKKLLSIMLATALLFSLATVALATGTNTITVNNAEPGATYKIYKMMSLTYSGDNYSYTVETNWKEFFTTGAGKDYVTIDAKDNVTWTTDANVDNLAIAAAEYAKTKQADDTQTASTTTVTFADKAYGYYLITSTNGTQAIIVSNPSNNEPTITEKNTSPTTEKKVQEDSTGAWGDDNSAQIGDTVNFKATIDVKTGAVNYVMHDKMTAGLTFNPDSVEVYDANGTELTKNTDYEVLTGDSKKDTDCTFEVAFDNDYLKTIDADTTLTVTYTAVLNKDAKPGEAELNQEKLTWGDQTSNTQGTAWDETKTTTYQFEILKYGNGDESNKLGGAIFELYNNDHNDAEGKATLVKLVRVADEDTDNSIVYRVATPAEITADESADEANKKVVTQFATVAGKTIIIKGVDLDTYELKEITAPDGFNLPKETITVEPTENETLTVKVENKSGTKLPSTGGMGTTIFYLLGTILVVSAGVLLVTKRRMAR